MKIVCDDIPVVCQDCIFVVVMDIMDYVVLF